jgi:hypothetical protein
VPNGKKLPKDVVEKWPEVFGDVDIEVIPVEYLHSVRITFSDGKIWEIDTTKNEDDIDFEDAIEALLIEYEDSIDNVDFQLDTEKVKQDIKKRTNTFMKKRK